MADNKPGIDEALIRNLANILNETDLTEIEVEQDDLRIRVSRAGTTQYVQAPMMTAPQQQMAAPAAAVAAAPAAPARNPDNVVLAPMVGTVYMASAPGARAFIEVGAMVKEGQTLLIIEAMKTMNQIPAPKSGKVTEILIEDGRPVEYGEALVIIE
ncbi:MULTISPECIES: acetyl-CoA carboxylase biotin carboxyl carrier protein [unclassified Rhizobium]|uniref:acetyl-CoA carboxylase biotin carboxyl carrier protein n=1 Tax=unclassified Rhizobium TaxID=2613769 RepID=UPI001ADC9A0D|nr:MULTISPECIES: acetyl-CoA carboxylase biotin carboxyl carrier protein [unclassified Rhizobium]MBO9098157.1 acetyl-CoA carboxylase biotin carboxyl carrier protein [Rhizobium sp. L58/93]MBO9133061.1 acetyl-CoA carboxylase biotin carboxyl carrier protein [Rhizobium sp. B209b/85]MBO9168307.1 acetyl-CoA carboxylase biotin carboxyl carrier protein [Rhizobium sp. L245/93]MBO9184353.1 acetyl-CoA carboxylase biotin carboxyl carrier protein [Rhizobium sp. E27B/91]QXZ84546.1 acetyl-CoA carboxylase biot